MSINSLSLYGTYGSNSAQSWSKNSIVEEETELEKAKKKATANNKTNTTGYNTQDDMIGSLAAAVKTAMAGLGLSSGDRVTFDTISTARKEMEEKFSGQVKKDLEALGVDKDIEFRLTADEKGGINVISSHDDKAKIEKYFKDNPEMVKKFNDIQALSKVEDARKAGGFDPEVVRSRIQMESLVAWFAGSGQNTQGFMGQSSGQTMFGSGVNKIA